MRPTGSATSSSSTRGTPNSTPIKHSALGRLKHEGANIYITDDGTVVVYTGDDERFDYMYKFISSKKMQPGSDPAAMAHNLTLLDEGTLYVAKLTSDIPGNEIDGSGKLPAKGSFNGSGTWMPLLRSGPNGQAESLVDGVTAQEAAVFTRLAADKAGATKMDRPEDFEANPKTGKVYVALTNNDERGAAGEAAVDAANPRNDNKSGQVLEITDSHAGTDFTWDLLLVCGDPVAADTYFAGFDKTKVSPISCPDNLAFDSHGNLWISTDGNALDSNDGLFAVALDGPEPRRDQAVPHRAAWCRDVRAGHHRRSGHRLRAAPRRERRQQHRQPAVAVAGRRQRHRASFGGGGVEERREYRGVSERTVRR